MSNLDPAGDALSTNAVYIPLPAYYPRDPRAWFVQADILFECRRINSRRIKFSQVVSQPPLEIVTDLLDVIDPIPIIAPYDTLKAALINTVDHIREKLTSVSHYPSSSLVIARLCNSYDICITW